MTPAELMTAATEIDRRWPEAVIYRPVSESNLPQNALLAVDLDKVWPHECDAADQRDCTGCGGEYRVVAWIDTHGTLHHVPTET